MITADELKLVKSRHADAAVVCYVNTSAGVKAESDICCTSSNAVKVVNSVKEDQVIFVPDRNLGRYVQRFTKKEILPWEGFCIVHDQITPGHVREARKLHPDAILLVHPECRPEVIDLADQVASTSGIIRYVCNAPQHEFIIGTEVVSCTTLGLIDGLIEADGLTLGLVLGLTDGLTEADGDKLGLIDGLVDGDNDALGLVEGLTDGETDGLTDALGDAEGLTDGETLGEIDADGLMLGLTDGLTDGLTLADGEALRLTLGETEGLILGETDGLTLGLMEADGEVLGLTDGLTEGETEADGDADGLTLGLTLGDTEADGDMRLGW